MNIPALLKPSDHTSEIALLGIIAVGVMGLTWHGMSVAAEAKAQFDPSAYLVVLTLICGAIKERWTQRSMDRMGQQLGQTENSKT